MDGGVSNQTEVEEAEESLPDRLAALQEEFDGFTFAISHDLRASVRHIIGFSELLQKECAGSFDERGDDYLNRIVRAAARLNRELEGLLGFYRWSKQPLNVERLNISELVESALSRLHGRDPSRNVNTVVAANCTAMGDISSLARLVEELLDNAWKCTRDCDEAQIEFGVLAKAGGAPVYLIRDNGIGFHSSQQSRLFKPFQQIHSDSAYQGIGMGLATAQRVVHRHGGRIWAEGAPDEGATFFFTLSPSPVDE